MKADYLVIGCGSSGLAFVDSLIAENPDATVVMIDRRERPGGHWNDAYPFVCLHQPSSFYGVNSLELCDGRIDADGLNQGLWGLATGEEVTRYFHSVMDERLLPSGRVNYMPSTEYLGDGRYRSLETGEEGVIEYGKLVDATYFQVSIPALHEPKFEVRDGATLIAPNALPEMVGGGAEKFVILGSGKTGMDSVVWLLEQGVAPDDIIWVRPREGWVMNRAGVQPGLDFYNETIRQQTAVLEATSRATNARDLFHRMEAAGAMLRIDPEAEPELYHYATCSKAEIERMRAIKNVVRGERVAAISPGKLHFAVREVAVPESAIFVDCTATAVTQRPTVPVFDGDRITLQMIRIPQSAISSALVAFIETTYDDDTAKNALARPIPIPDTIEDYLTCAFLNMTNQKAWAEAKPVKEWMVASRLDGYAKTITNLDPEDHDRRDKAREMRRHMAPAYLNLMRLVQEARRETD